MCLVWCRVWDWIIINTTSWLYKDSQLVVERAREVGCKHQTCPFIYLGIPIGNCMSILRAWKLILAKLQNKLQGWKSKFLSKVGKLTLMKNVLNNLPIYYMGMFKMPKEIVKKIISLQRNVSFLGSLWAFSSKEFFYFENGSLVEWVMGL